MSSATTESHGFAVWLCVLGAVSAIYHPVGWTMLVTHARRLGRDLGWNGVWGNFGAAIGLGRDRRRRGDARLAGGLRGARLVCLAAGPPSWPWFRATARVSPSERERAGIIPVSRPVALMGVFALAIIAGGMTFNVTTISLPKVIDERLGLALPLALTGSLATVVFVFGALTQLAMGRLVDRFSLPSIFVGISMLQPVGLGMAAMTTGVPMLIGLVLAMAAIYGQVVVNDAMVARYVPASTGRRPSACATSWASPPAASRCR